jgi:carbon monoxide dehydrogenase subunit G
MASWKNSIVIHAPADSVFAYVDEPTQLAEWLPSIVEVRNVIGTGAGQQFEWTAKMAGRLLRGQSTVIEHVPNRCAVHQSIGMVSSTFGYTVEPLAEGTALTLEIEYKIPIPLLGRLAERVLIRRNIREFELALINVKETLES